MKRLKKSVSITIDKNVDAVIRKLAAKNSRSFSQYINLVLKQHIETMRHS